MGRKITVTTEKEVPGEINVSIRVVRNGYIVTPGVRYQGTPVYFMDSEGTIRSSGENHPAGVDRVFSNLVDLYAWLRDNLEPVEEAAA